MATSISVVIRTHDRPEGLAAAVESLLGQRRLPDELIIVNDGAGEIDAAIGEKVRAAAVPFVYRRQAEPSATASRNCGMAMASGDAAVLLDDDVVPAPDFLARLESLYEADAAGVVGAICGRYVEPPARLTKRAWDAIASALAENRWARRIAISRYVRLPPALRGRLAPAWRFPGGVVSFRKRVYRSFHGTEDFVGYGLGEDTELSLRLGRQEALFVAPELAVVHDRGPTGRPESYARGRQYAASMLYIARNSTPGGAGQWLLLGYHLTGMTLLAAAWSLLSGKRANLGLAAGLAVGILNDLRQWARGLLCG